jgi:hypothetical protein
VSGRGDWGVQGASLTLPPFAGPADAAIIIGEDLPTCMQAAYASAIFWRGSTSLSPNSAPIYFIGQRKAPVGGNNAQIVDHGWLVNDGVNPCGYVVMRRVGASNTAGAITMTDVIDPTLDVSGLTVFATQVQWRAQTDIFVLGSAKFNDHGDDLSLRNFVNNGACTANSSTSSATFANYPTNCTAPITKLWGSGHTVLNVLYSQTYHVSNTDTGPKFAVNVGGTDYPTHHVPGGSIVGVRLSSVGFARIPFLAAGSYTVTPRWARYGGTSTVNSSINDDFTALAVWEDAA